MYQRISKVLLVIAATYGLMSCAITSSPMEKKLMADGATALTSEQVVQHLGGKTQVWSNGGAYFDRDGSVIVKFEGKVFPVRIWKINDNKVCILLPDGFVTSCSSYYLKDGKVWVVTLEIFGEAQYTAGAIDSDVRAGNHLEDLKWDDLI